MNRNLLIKILTYLKDTKKAVFIVEVVNRDKQFNFKVTRDSIGVQVLDRETGINELDLVSDELENVLPIGEFKIKSITEKVYTLKNELYSSFFYNCLDSTQVYLPLFRVLRDQVVCLVKNPSGKLEKLFFINGRVFMINRTEEYLEINQTDLRKMFMTYSIVDFEPLARKYSYSSLFALAESYAKENNLKMSVKKFGVTCQ